MKLALLLGALLGNPMSDGRIVPHRDYLHPSLTKPSSAALLRPSEYSVVYKFRSSPGGAEEGPMPLFVRMTFQTPKFELKGPASGFPGVAFYMPQLGGLPTDTYLQNLYTQPVEDIMQSWLDDRSR